MHRTVGPQRRVEVQCQPGNRKTSSRATLEHLNKT
jgi:hypothetical protein